MKTTGTTTTTDRETRTSNTGDQDNLFYISYTTRDTLLYAVALGFGNHPASSAAATTPASSSPPSEAPHDTTTTYRTDLPYVWEGPDHGSGSPFLRVVPTWVTTWPFWATRTPSTGTSTTARLPRFPPPTLDTTPHWIPPQCWVHETPAGAIALDDYPILHTAQHIVWHTPQLPSHGTFQLQRHVVAVVPKAVGTFVTTQFEVRPYPSHASSVPVIVTLQVTALIVGLDPTKIRPWRAAESVALPAPPRSTRSAPTPKQQHYTVTVPPNQALLYRLASGDTNAIHVVDGDGDDEPCLLHGLATLGLVARVLLTHQTHHGLSSYTWHTLDVTFTAPVHVGETLAIAVTWPGDADAPHSSVPRVVPIPFHVTVHTTRVLQGVVTLVRRQQPPTTTHCKL